MIRRRGKMDEIRWLRTQIAKSRHRQKSKGCCVKVDDIAYNRLLATANAAGMTIRQLATAAIMQGHGINYNSPDEAAFYGIVCRLRQNIIDGNADKAGATAAEVVLYGINHPTETDIERAEDWAKVANNAAITAKYCAVSQLLKNAQRGTQPRAERPGGNGSGTAAPTLR